VSFKNTIIIMTSNAGAERIISPKTLGFASAVDLEADYKKMKEGVMEEVKRLFKPEFINRIDEIMVFHPLTKDNIREIVEIMLNNISRRTESQMNITLKPTKGCIDQLVESGYDEKYGARPLRRAIQTQVEDKLAEAVLEGSVKQGDTISVRLKGKEIVFSVKP
jgi:ATP-dependent Clp protease ATP-binding subunit ClpC